MRLRNSSGEQKRNRGTRGRSTRRKGRGSSGLLQIFVNKWGTRHRVVGEKNQEGGVDIKRQKTKQSLEQVSGQQAFWGVSQEVVRMDTTWSKLLPRLNWIWFSIWPKRGLDLNFVWMRSADHLSNEKEEKGFDAWHKIILGGFDLLLDTLPPICNPGHYYHKSKTPS